MLKTYLLTAIFCFCFLVSAFAQDSQPVYDSLRSIKNIKLNTSNPNLFQITYDLTGSRAGELYNVMIFSSADNFTKPLLFVSGDVGTDVKTGKSKRIYWKAQTELNGFEGQLSIEIRAVLAYAPLIFTKTIPDAKRGKNITIAWNGSRSNYQVVVELFSEDSTKIRTLATVPNTGSFVWKVPDKEKIADNYKIKVSSLNTPNDLVMSNEFAIKRKIPTNVKLIPAGVALLVGAVVVVSGKAKNEEDPDLPAPPAPRK